MQESKADTMLKIVSYSDISMIIEIKPICRKRAKPTSCVKSRELSMQIAAKKNNPDRLKLT